MSARGRVCIYNEYLYPVLVPDHAPFAGGAEMQLAHFARGLVASGFEVTVVSCDFGQPPESVVGGIRMLRTYDSARGLPLVRFFHPRLSTASRALWRADAEAYYVNGSGMAAGLTADIARMKRAGYVNHCASDYDVTRAGVRQLLNRRDRWWYVRGIRHADALLAQTEWQRAQFRGEFGVESEVLPNLVRIPERAAEVTGNGPVIWIGTYKEIKRPDWFLRLADDLPQARFVMAGVVPPPPFSTEHWERARARAATSANLEVRGFQSPAGVAALMEGASLLVHTSPVEGFSNVLLEAWACGLPTVSCVNPDGLVTREGLGAAVDDYPSLLEAVRRFIQDPAARGDAGVRARAYAARLHAPAIVLDQLASVMDRVVAKVRARRR